jgi:RimJ/RimL family protein N-acetyltransferase
MTTYMDINAMNKRVEIGFTWYRKSMQRTAVNSECKLLLLTHAFEVLQCIAVRFSTNYFNVNSRRAIERLGAKLDGVLRNHRMMPNGVIADYCIYTIIKCEWPAVKTNLHYKLS